MKGDGRCTQGKGVEAESWQLRIQRTIAPEKEGIRHKGIEMEASKVNSSVTPCEPNLYEIDELLQPVKTELIPY